MNRTILYLMSLAMSVSAAQAQTFGHTDCEGNPSYYRLTSAHAAHLDACIEDCSAHEASAYTYRITPVQQANAAQEWQFVPTAQTDFYLLRNRQTGRFIGRQGHFVQGAWTLFSQPEETACAFRVTGIGDNQYAISFTDQAMETRYLCVADSAQQHCDAFSTLAPQLINSRWAWTIEPSGTSGSSVEPVAGTRVWTSVSHHRIQVHGTDAYQVVDMQGRLVDGNGYAHPSLPAGIYIVLHGGGSLRVVVK